ncbi:hypothetical protein MBM_02749 [Drepanopeziza brunnea f. sp. 'multigermtubi' MB_m1]|uniref:Uncharacterized protein n=1 Tax=Marssonina brunnea f. sp. multigermtubi (strain MB_m1) TaxID=1072389 RepID=K1X3B1_MARBU|nr:uncharacterized protein MBM_02749 [Drepanopeziza brunnea f. sp. 'multigermtubi' MB_m1]EKD19512.1 hypothetical protein MBM_02749 [Drepanopeziza brunnea f. sp. 'multigermtubi' MB_m1]
MAEGDGEIWGIWPRNMASEYSVGSTTLTTGAILGIAIGGAFLLFLLLAGIGILLVKKRHRRERARNPEGGDDEHMDMDMDLKTAIRCTQPPDVGRGRRLSHSFAPFLPVTDNDTRHEWTKQDGLQVPPMARSNSTHRKGFFRTPSVRDSWPLITPPTLPFLPGQSSMVPCPVAPPGYVVGDIARWPKRTAPILGRKNSQDSSKSASPTRDPHVLDVMPYRRIHRRSTSEDQLSTILRSTSQRLRDAQRKSMTRTLSSLAQSPGLPPSERLPTPPMRKAIESREVLIDPPENAESVGSSIYEYARTPSPNKRTSRSHSQRSLAPSPASSNRSPKFPKSPSPSVESKDSLCEVDTPDRVIPSPLASPSRRSSREPKRHPMRTSSDAKDVSVTIHNDAPAPLFATGSEGVARSKSVLKKPQRISLTSDPFYTSVRSPKPIMPLSLVQGPRPMSIRKATFGQEANPERPPDFNSPLRDVSGNARTTPKSPLPDPPARTDQNPFQWSPQEAMHTRDTQTSPMRSSPHKKGHKRSNIVRVPNLSRPPSTIVDAVPEEPEEASPLRRNANPRYCSFLSASPPKSTNSSPTRSVASSRRTSVRPPSTSTFNPTVIIAALNSPSLALTPEQSPTHRSPTSEAGPSPTMSICNYYNELDTPTSEHGFFKPKAPISTSLQASPSTKKERRRAKNYSADYSADLALFSSHQNQQNQHERLLFFPPLPLATPSPTLTPRPDSRPLPNITSTMSGLRSKAVTPAPPLLTGPDHPTGPRSEPGAHTRATLSPPRDSMASTIGMLRRMNSEISLDSCNSLASIENEHSPALLGRRSPTRSRLSTSTTYTPLIEERGRSRGSQHYLSLGRPLSRTHERRTNRTSGVEKRDSHRIHKEKRKKRSEEQGSGMLVDELTPVKEGSSPLAAPNSLDRATERNTIANALGLRFPTLSHEGSVRVTPTKERERRGRQRESVLAGVERDDFHGFEPVAKSGGVDGMMESDHHDDEDDADEEKSRSRWSDAMCKPAALSIRRESKMEHPAPVTPPKWTLSGLGLAGVRLMDQDAGDRVNRAEGGDDRAGRPGSSGYYDNKGFLKDSPDRETISRMEAKEGKMGLDVGSGAREGAGAMRAQAMEERTLRRERERERGRERYSAFVM